MSGWTRPNANLREGSEVLVPGRPHWGACTVVDCRDAALLRVFVPALGRELVVGRAAVCPIGPRPPDL